MDDFEARLNDMLTETFAYIQKYEAVSLSRISKFPITISEAHMIDAVGRQDGAATVGTIASRLSIALPTATVAVKKLERKGFVFRVPCEEDGRKSIISLTDNGRHIYRAHRIFHRRMVKNVSKQFCDAEKDILLAVVKQLSEFFREKAEIRHE